MKEENKFFQGLTFLRVPFAKILDELLVPGNLVEQTAAFAQMTQAFLHHLVWAKKKILSLELVNSNFKGNYRG